MASLTAGEKVLESFSFIQEISQRSLKLCAQLEEELDGLEFFSVPIACIFAVGSAGRLEIGPCSDLDGVVVLRTGVSDLAEIRFNCEDWVLISLRYRSQFVDLVFQFRDCDNW